MTLLTTLIGTLLFAVAGPVIGCLLAGLDRIISARMQGRVGPPLLQPYYDVRKLFEKERVSVNSVEGVYVACALLFALIAGGIFYSGGNLLLCVFVITLSSLFFIMAAYSTRSPYAEVGAARETLQVMSYEPMVLLMAVAFFRLAGSSTWPRCSSSTTRSSAPLARVLGRALHPHHQAAQVALRPVHVASRPSGDRARHDHRDERPTLGMVEIMHWCENVLFLGWIGMFFLWANPVSILVAVVIVLLVYFLEIWIDNNFARVKWQFMFKSAWLVALIAGGVNVAFLAFL
ncbi:MAG: NADH-quinone oxidoreductase subunit H [Coriobacteriaceae bacterium]